MTPSTYAFSSAPLFVRPFLLALLLTLTGCGGGGGGGSGSGGGPSSPPPNNGGNPPTQGPTAVSIGGAVSGLVGSGLILQNNDGDDLAIAADGAFVFPNTVAAGSGTYRVSVKRRPANPMQTCVVTQGSGTAASSNVTNVAVTCSNDVARFIYQYDPALRATGIYISNDHTGQLRRIGVTPQVPRISATDPTGRFVYMIPSESELIYSYAIDPGTGTLSEVAPPLAAGTGTVAAHVHPNGRFLYLANANEDRIVRFSIGDNGALTPLPPLSLEPGSFPHVSRMTSDGHYLIVGNTGSLLGDTGVSNIAVFALDAANGALSPVPGSPFASPTVPFDIELAVNDSLLYVTSHRSNLTAAFRFDRATGALSAIPAPTRINPTQTMVAHPGLPYFYMVHRVAGGGLARVDAFSIDEASGQFTSAGIGNPGMEGVAMLEIDPTGRYLYAYAEIFSTICFTIDAATGRLTDRRVISGRRERPLFVKAGARPSMGAKFVFTAHEGPSNVSAYTVDSATGGVSSVSTSLPTRVSAWNVEVDSRGRFLYVGDIEDNTLSSYAIGQDGSLTPMFGGRIAGVERPFQLRMHPSDKYLFVSSETTPQIYVFSVDSTGALARIAVVPLPYTPTEMAMHPDGGRLYVVNQELLSIFAVSETGQLTRELDRDIDGATGIALHPNGRFFYEVSFTSRPINIYDRDLPAGVAPQTAQPESGAPFKIAIDPSGRFAYVLNSIPSISAFFVDSTNGALSSMPQAPYVVEGLPSALAFDAAGKMLYVTTTGPDSVIAFQVDGASGALTRVGSPVPSGRLSYGMAVAGTRE